MLTIFFINMFLVTMAILIHYEMLYRLSSIIPHLTIRHRYRVVFGIFGAMIAHVFEVWLFAVGYYVLIQYEHYGDLTGAFDQTLWACGYFSFTTYTTLGFGDIVPSGHIRFLVGLESLTGLVLITWTASFMFFEMQKFWNKK